MYPSWRVNRVELVEPFGWHILDAELMRHIHEKLRNFETRTWNDIWVKDKHNNHAIAAEKLCSEAKKRLRTLGMDDQEQLWRLRLTGKQRVWGIFQHGVFQLLWWDPLHLVYPYEKPNT
jgi:hypothetical protein